MFGENNTEDQKDLIEKIEGDFKKDFQNSFRNICETEEDLEKSAKKSERDYMVSRERDPESMKYSINLKTEDNQKMKILKNTNEEEVEMELSGDEEDPFEKLEKAHLKKMEMEVKNEKTEEEWFDNYRTENGEEKGAKITGSRLIESTMEETIRMDRNERDPVPKGREAKEFPQQNQSRRPIDLGKMEGEEVGEMEDSEEEAFPEINDKFRMSLKDALENEEIVISNSNGELRMTKRIERKDKKKVNMYYEEKQNKLNHSDTEFSDYTNDSDDSREKDPRELRTEDPRNGWEEDKRGAGVGNSLEIDEDLYDGTNLLNDSQLSGKHAGSGIINELLVPDLVKEETRNVYNMTEEQIKEEFMKKNYQSHFSMGGGYDDIEEGERKFEEFRKQMNA